MPTWRPSATPRARPVRAGAWLAPDTPYPVALLPRAAKTRAELARRDLQMALEALAHALVGREAAAFGHARHRQRTAGEQAPRGVDAQALHIASRRHAHRLLEAAGE